LVKFAVIAGSASKDLGKRIARRLKAPYVEAKTRVFPDGERRLHSDAYQKIVLY